MGLLDLYDVPPAPPYDRLSHSRVDPVWGDELAWNAQIQSYRSPETLAAMRASELEGGPQAGGYFGQDEPRVLSMRAVYDQPPGDLLAGAYVSGPAAALSVPAAGSWLGLPSLPTWLVLALLALALFLVLSS